MEPLVITTVSMGPSLSIIHIKNLFIQVGLQTNNTLYKKPHGNGQYIPVYGLRSGIYMIVDFVSIAL